MLFYEAGLLSFTPSERLKRLGSSNVEMQLTSLLLVHQDTGLDAPLKEAQDLCCQMANRIGPGSDAACSSEQILYADIQHAAFLRNEDLASLNEAISCYEGITVLDPILSRRLALGHGRALATLYAHVTGIEHAEKAAQLLSSVLVDNSHDEVAAHALCYLVPLIDQIKWDGEGHSDMADNDYESQLNNVLNTPRRIYLRIMLLLTRCHVAARLSFSKSHHIAADEWYQFSRAALDACPPDHFLLARAYSSLANMYDWRHHLVGDVQDLNLAIDLVAKGLQIHSLTPSMRCTLTKIKIRSLGAQSQATGDLNLLEHAIGLNRMILDLCPPRHRSYPLYVNELMFLLGTHFEITGRIGFIDEIISFAELDIVVKNQWIACNVAEAMRYRAQLASSGTGFVLLQRAIYILKARHEHSSNVSTREKAYISRELGAVYDLQAGIGIYIDQRARLQLARDTVTLGRDAHGGHMENIISLATVLLNQGLRIASAPLIDEAEELIRDALKDQRLPYRLQPTLIALQAELSIIRISMGNISGNILDAWGIFEAVVTDTGGRPRDRLQIAIRWAALAESIDAKSALLAYQRAVEILPQVGYIGEDIMGRVQALRQARDLAPRAASLALRIGEVKQAVELIEHSRGVLWQQSLHLRPPLHLLPPHLSSQLADVSKDLDSSQTSSAERRQSAEKFQSIVLEIRCEPEHEEFLLPRTYSQLVERLPDGFVVWLIPSKTHCDAIIVDSRTRPQATHFRQDGLNQEWLQAIATAFTTVHASALRSIDRKTRPAPLLKEDSASPNHELLLEDLWSNLVQKVIRTLGVAPIKKGGDRPRLWWCPIGPLTFLPLHAAGIYHGSRQECVSDYVISSYIPTVTSLVNASEARLSEPPPGNDDDRNQVLLVAQPKVQGLPPLLHAIEEATVVRSIVPEGAIINLEKDSAGEGTVQSVLARLPEASVFHLACHATQCKDDPLQSGFDFVDGRLTLRELMRVNHPRAQLAYLSACESAAADENQPDEAINLAATMLFVGFKSVIATMWSMNDIDGPFVAERIYKRVFHNGVLNLDLVPYALDAAIGELRQRGVDASRWATFVHIGK